MASLVKHLHLIDSKPLFFWRTHGGSRRPAAGRRMKSPFYSLDMVPAGWEWRLRNWSVRGIVPRSGRFRVFFGKAFLRHDAEEKFQSRRQDDTAHIQICSSRPRVSRPPGSFPGPTRWCLEGWKPSDPAVRTAKGSRRVEVIDDWTKGTGRTFREFRPMGMPSVGESAARSGQPMPAASARRPEHSFGESHLHVRTWRLDGHGGERDGVPS